MGTAQTRTCAGLLLGIPGSSRIPSSTKKNIHLLVPQRFAHGPETIFGEAGRISPAKSASVYECLPYIWPYNAQPVLLKNSTGRGHKDGTATNRQLGGKRYAVKAVLY